MTNLFSSAIARLNSWLKGIQVKQFLAIALVGFVVLAANPSMGRNSEAGVAKKVDQAIHQNDSDRPKTMREWESEAKRTEDSPIERVKEIGKESAEAVKDWGELYPDVAERSVRATQD